MTKTKKIILFTTLIILLAITLTAVFYYFGATHPNYEKINNEEFSIPGLNEKFVPQGFDYDSNSSNYFISGYMSDKQPSRIYCVDEDNAEEAKYVTIAVDGESFTGHTGGIAVSGNYVWIASDGHVYRLKKSEIVNAKNKAEIEVVDYFKTGNGADSVTIHNNKLWVGEFYMNKKYETPTEHHIEVAENETNRAVAYAYEINTNKPYGISSTTPTCGLSLPDKAQGFDFTKDNKIIVSTSYSIPNSHLYIYDNPFEENNIETITTENGTLSVYRLSSKILKQDIEAPSMSEEVIVKDNKLFILYESACKKWKWFNRTRIEKIHSITIEN